MLYYGKIIVSIATILMVSCASSLDKKAAGLDGSSEAVVLKRLGSPSIKREEGPSVMWQYNNDTEALLVFFKDGVVQKSEIIKK